MCKYALPLILVMSGSSALAQSLPSFGDTKPPIYASHAAVETAVQDFRTVCLSLYKTATDNPNDRVSLQDVDWPDGYVKYTDSYNIERYKKHIDDITITADLNFNASKLSTTTVEAWDGDKLVKRPENNRVLGVNCTFHFTPNKQSELGEFNASFIESYESNQIGEITSKAESYALERANEDCDFSHIREARFNIGVGQSIGLLFYTFWFTHDPLKPTKDLLICKARAHKDSLRHGGYQIHADGNVTNSSGNMIGRVNTDGKIVDAYGNIVSRKWLTPPNK